MGQRQGTGVNGPAPRGVLRVGDKVRFEEAVHQVVAIEGTTVRLVAADGRHWLAAVSFLTGSPGFEVVGEPLPGQRPVLPPFAMLDTVAEPAAQRARFRESHILEVLTGRSAGAAEGQEPRPEFDPRLRTLTEREAAKAAELMAAGEPVSVRTLMRMRQRYESQGLWRVVEAIAAAMDEQTDASTGTRERAWRRAQEILAARHPGRQVPFPSRATIYRVISQLEGGRHTFGSAALDLRKPQDYFHRVWSTAFRASDLAATESDGGAEDDYGQNDTGEDEHGQDARAYA